MPAQLPNNAVSKPTVNPWLIALTVSMATFMEVMDISIANVALRHIAGNVGADLSESTWVLTSYLISNAIVLPISGWLSAVLGRKRFYLGCVAVFTSASFLCGMAPTLGWLLLFRVIQGAGGGGLAPSEQAILADTFPPQQRGMGFAVYGIAVVVAPALGPALGGWITDHLSWRWIFFINVPVGILSYILVSLLVRDPESVQKEHEAVTRGGIQVDYIGFAFVALGFGCLQVVLDKGQEEDWFASHFILAFAILAAVGLLGMVVWELFGTRRPIVDLPLMRDRSFLLTNAMRFATMFVLLATTQLLPQLEQDLLGYNAVNAGLSLMPGGLVVMALMPVAGFLVKKIQPKYLIAFGFLLTAFGLWHLASLDTNASFEDLAVARIFQVMGLPFLFVPTQTLAFADLPPGKTSNASALVSLMRNLGGSIGISVGATLLVRHTQIQRNHLVAHLTPTSGPFRAEMHSLSAHFAGLGAGPVIAQQRALAVVGHQVQAQAAMLAYLDVFKFLILACLIAAVLTAFLKRIKLGEAGTEG